MRQSKIALEKIGARIRDVRINKQIKQATLAKSVNLSKSEISRIENGQRETKIIKLLEIARVLDIKPSLLFEE